MDLTTGVSIMVAMIITTWNAWIDIMGAIIVKVVDEVGETVIGVEANMVDQVVAPFSRRMETGARPKARLNTKGAIIHSNNSQPTVQTHHKAKGI